MSAFYWGTGTPLSGGFGQATVRSAYSRSANRRLANPACDSVLNKYSRGSSFTPNCETAIRGVLLSYFVLESWEESLRWIAPDQRERFEEPEFYELLQREITSRFCRAAST